MPRLAPSGNPVGVAYDRSFGQGSGIQVFDAQITEVEDARDILVITEHPVEQGATISDHAYKRPEEVTVRMWFIPQQSDSDPDYVRTVYNQLVALQNSRKPFDLYTGKRVYANMLVSTLVVETSQETEYALKAEVAFHHVILVKTQTAAAPKDQAAPDRTSGTTNTGTNQLQTAPNANQQSITATLDSQENAFADFQQIPQPLGTAGSTDLDIQEVPVAQSTPQLPDPGKTQFPQGIEVAPIAGGAVVF